MQPRQRSSQPSWVTGTGLPCCREMVALPVGGGAQAACFPPTRRLSLQVQPCPSPKCPSRQALNAKGQLNVMDTFRPQMLAARDRVWENVTFRKPLESGEGWLPPLARMAGSMNTTPLPALAVRRGGYSLACLCHVAVWNHLSVEEEGSAS